MVAGMEHDRQPAEADDPHAPPPILREMKVKGHNIFGWAHASVADFKAWCTTTGNELVEESEMDKVFRFVIRKK